MTTQTKQTHTPTPLLSSYERWMVDRNVEYARKQGLSVVVLRLRSRGYNRVADAVESKLKARTE